MLDIILKIVGVAFVAFILFALGYFTASLMYINAISPPKESQTHNSEYKDEV